MLTENVHLSCDLQQLEAYFSQKPNDYLGESVLCLKQVHIRLVVY